MSDDVVPDGWRVATLGDVGVWGSGGTPKSGESSYYGGSIPWAIIGDLADGPLSETKGSITQAGLDNSSAKWVEPGTVLIGMYGSIGKLGMARIRCTTNQAIAFCRTDPDVMTADYLFYFLLARRDELLAAGKGDTQQNISQTVLRAFPVAFPPVSDQATLVARLGVVLTRTGRARQALAAVPKLLEKLRKSILAAAFRGDLTAVWRDANPNGESASALLDRIRAERKARWEATSPKRAYVAPKPVDPEVEGLPELPIGWVWARLEELAANEANPITDGPFGSKLKSEHYVPAGIRVVRLGNIGVGRFVDTVTAYVPAERGTELWKHHVLPGDMLIAAMAEPVGRACVAPDHLGPAIVKADCIRFRANALVERDVIVHWLNSPGGRAGAEAAAHGAGRVRMNLAEMKALPIPLPPADEARVMAALITDALQHVETLARSSAGTARQIPRLEKAILARAFRGELLDPPVPV